MRRRQRFTQLLFLIYNTIVIYYYLWYPHRFTCTTKRTTTCTLYLYTHGIRQTKITMTMYRIRQTNDTNMTMYRISARLKDTRPGVVQGVDPQQLYSLWRTDGVMVCHDNILLSVELTTCISLGEYCSAKPKVTSKQIMSFGFAEQITNYNPVCLRRGPG